MNIESIFNKAYYYIEYRTVVDKLLYEGKTTGNEQTPEKVEYTKLNIQRMNRLDKTIQLPETVKHKLEEIENPMLWLLIGDAWCGDCAQILPVINKMAEASNGNIKLKIISRDNCPELLQNLFEGNRAIPKLITLDEHSFEFICTWGSRPMPANEIMLNWKANKDKISKEEFEKELHLWYARDRGVTIINELMNLIENCEKKSKHYSISA